MRSKAWKLIEFKVIAGFLRITSFYYRQGEMDQIHIHLIQVKECYESHSSSRMAKFIIPKTGIEHRNIEQINLLKLYIVVKASMRRNI